MFYDYHARERGSPNCVYDESLYKAGAIFPTNLPRASMVRTAVRIRFKCYLHIMSDESRTTHVQDSKIQKTLLSI